MRECDIDRGRDVLKELRDSVQRADAIIRRVKENVVPELLENLAVGCGGKSKLYRDTIALWTDDGNLQII